ncbi:hypothetical protein A0H81_09774 [Grifola frondosa]|uniref:Uncharacterized protein n=1 Tax=Grifola frondosa TaxID=5627 RepID=A0A1C7M0J2_GRIFR|nr:hypothetical protein A0H81_09774 [Grifola frondosa]
MIASFLALLSGASRQGHTAFVINISSISGITASTLQHHFKSTSPNIPILLFSIPSAAIHSAIFDIILTGREYNAPGNFPSEMATESSNEMIKSFWR